MSLPPWIRSIQRPLDKLVTERRSFEDLPDTEPGEEDVGAVPRSLRKKRPGPDGEKPPGGGATE